MRPGDDFFRYVNGKLRFRADSRIPSRVGAYMFMNYPQRMRLQILDSISNKNPGRRSTAQR
jgi:putative endopeptidase